MARTRIMLLLAGLVTCALYTVHFILVPPGVHDWVEYATLGLPYAAAVGVIAGISDPRPQGRLFYLSRRKILCYVALAGSMLLAWRAESLRSTSTSSGVYDLHVCLSVAWLAVPFFIAQSSVKQAEA